MTQVVKDAATKAFNELSKLSHEEFHKKLNDNTDKGLIELVRIINESEDMLNDMIQKIKEIITMIYQKLSQGKINKKINNSQTDDIKMKLDNVLSDIENMSPEEYKKIYGNDMVMLLLDEAKYNEDLKYHACTIINN